MLNAFSREIRSIRAQENIGVHSGLRCSSNIFPKKVILTYMVRSSPSVYGPISKLIRGKRASGDGPKPKSLNVRFCAADGDKRTSNAPNPGFPIYEYTAVPGWASGTRDSHVRAPFDRALYLAEPAPLHSGTTCTAASILLKASAGPCQEPESGEAFSCSRATATETCSPPTILLLVGSNPCQPAPGM